MNESIKKIKELEQRVNYLEELLERIVKLIRPQWLETDKS